MAGINFTDEREYAPKLTFKNNDAIHNVSNLLCGFFELDAKTSSATKCKCGREKWEHTKTK